MGRGHRKERKPHLLEKDFWYIVQFLLIWNLIWDINCFSLLQIDFQKHHEMNIVPNLLLFEEPPSKNKTVRKSLDSLFMFPCVPLENVSFRSTKQKVKRPLRTPRSHGHNKITSITWNFYFQFWKIDKKGKNLHTTKIHVQFCLLSPVRLRESEDLIEWRFFSWVLCTSLLKTGLKKTKTLFCINKTAGLLSRMSMAGKFLHVFIIEIQRENLLPVGQGLEPFLIQMSPFSITDVTMTPALTV